MAFVCVMTTAEQSPAQVTTGTLQGRVYTIDPDGTRSFIPGATVSVNGPASSQHVAADQQAMYRFPELAPGQYRVEAAAPGLAGSSLALVVPNRVTDVSVELQIALIKETVTVTASAEESPRTETSEQSVIGKSAVINAPNKSDRADALLPMIPGVVRGPDGLINMKGARGSQGGALINSANVTDPGYGGFGTYTLNFGSLGSGVNFDFIQEVQVKSGGFEAQYGEALGGVVKHVED